jgi:hypothetical protein
MKSCKEKYLVEGGLAGYWVAPAIGGAGGETRKVIS